VVDDRGALIGIVSEGDLIHRIEAGTELHHSWWLNLLTDKATLAREFVKSHAVKAADVMTKPVITASRDMALGDLASLLEKHRIKRVPIVDHGKLVGIVSRANLLQALAALRRDIAVESSVDDSVLRERVLSVINSKAGISTSQINVIVHNAVVELWGCVDEQNEKDALRVAAELTPGVSMVADHIGIGTSKLHYGILKAEASRRRDDALQRCWPAVCASIYPGYHPGTGMGSVATGTLYALVDGAVGGAILAWLYNASASRKT
jgi:CBS domain-containing protein